MLREDISPHLPRDVNGIFTIQGSGGVIYLDGFARGTSSTRGMKYFSRDLGESWILRLDVTIGAIDPFNPCRLSSYDVAQVSVDCGITWRSLPKIPKFLDRIIADPRNIKYFVWLVRLHSCPKQAFSKN